MSQLTLLDHDRTLTAKQAGLRTNIEDGRARLLAVLVKRGLRREDLPAAALLILSWDAHAPVDPEFRLCVCGCGRTLKGRRVTAKHFDGARRVRAHRARAASTRPQPSESLGVTVPRPRPASDGVRNQIGLAA